MQPAPAIKTRLTRQPQDNSLSILWNPGHFQGVSVDRNLIPAIVPVPFQPGLQRNAPRGKLLPDLP